MKEKMYFSKEVDVRYVQVNVAVRYDDEDMPYDFPFREGDVWDVTIDLDTHKIENWPKGKSGSFDMKITDQGIYTLLDGERNRLSQIDGYVPNNLLPGEFGDYLELKIAEDGLIENWLAQPSLDNFPEFSNIQM